MIEINNWERESIQKIRDRAENTRRHLDQLLGENKKMITKELEQISTQLKTHKENDDYSENDLTEWLHQLENLKKQLSSPQNAKLEKINDETWLQHLQITQFDKFQQVCHDIQILENGFIAEHGQTTSHAEVRGFAKYSTGTHRIRLKIEKMTNNNWMFWGIISQNTPMKNDSYSSTSANGWAKKSNQVYLNGRCNNGYGNYQGDVVENDILHLILNCDSRNIELENERTKHKYSIPIDLTGCPFPWQLHINLYDSKDRIRILI